MNWFWDNIHLKKEEREAIFPFVGILVFLVVVKWYMVVMYTPKVSDYGYDLAAQLEFTHLESPPKKAFAPISEKRNSSAKRKQKKGAKRKPSAPQKKDAPTPVKQQLLFDFDPNAATYDSLLLLGISQYAANNIIKYREKGGRFKATNDLVKIYGLDSGQFSALQPHIKITRPPNFAELDKSRVTSKAKVKPNYAPKIIDINRADTTELKSLRGIGSVYANRIVKFRKSLGGYFTIDQIKDVWGISDSLYTSIRPFLSLDTSTLKKKNINALDKESLVKHPYIDWRKARYILSYKKMHGDFKSMDDFEKLHGLDEKFVDTLKHYFVVQ